jgi:hypothetical protein
MPAKKQSTQPVVTEQTPVVASVPTPTVQTAPSEPVAKKVTKRGKSAENKVDVAPAPEPAVVQQTITPIVVASESAPVVEKKGKGKKQAVVASESAPVVVAPVVTEQPKVEVAPTKKGGKKAKVDVAQPAPVVEVKVEPAVASTPSSSTEAEKPKRGKGKKGVDVVVDVQPAVQQTVSPPVAVQAVAETAESKKTGGRKKKVTEQVVEQQVVSAPVQPVVQQAETVAEKPAKAPRAKKVKAEVVVEPQVAVAPAPVVVEQNAEAVAPPKKEKTYFKLEYADGEVGRYSSKSHKATASSSKAFNKLLRLKRKSGQSDDEILNVEHEFTIRECNRMKGNEKSKHKFIGISKRLPEPLGVPIGKENVQLRDANGKPLRDANGKLVKEKKELIVHQQGPNKEYLFNADGTPKMGKKLIWHFYDNKVRKAPKPVIPLTEKQLQRRQTRQEKLAQLQELARQQAQAPVATA